jgi:RNA-binding protein NOB1
MELDNKNTALAVQDKNDDIEFSDEIREVSLSQKADLLEYLVIDAGAVIRGHGYDFHLIAKKLVTVSEVLAEIRDGKSRALLDSLPYEIEIRTPSDESMRAVATFARKTGDFAALSANDLKILALTYTIDCEIHGNNERLRKEPVKNSSSSKPQVEKKTFVPPPKLTKNERRNRNRKAKEALERGETTEEIITKKTIEGEGFEEMPDVHIINSIGESCDCGSVNNNKDGNIHNHMEEIVTKAELIVVEKEEAAEEIIEEDSNNNIDVVNNELHNLTVEEVTPKPSTSSWASIAATKASPKPFIPRVKAKEAKIFNNNVITIAPVVEKKETIKEELNNEQKLSHIISGGSNSSSSKDFSEKMALEDDGSDWVGPTNIADARARGLELEGLKIKQFEDENNVLARVACMTTDFTMQNISIQMGMHIMSVDGLLIKTVKQWILRCMGCFQLHHDMDRLFCSRCGANHLSRVACSIDARTGELRLHLRKNYQVQTRGTKYSLPKPGSQGRFTGELLLREDQLLHGIWRQKCVKIRKDIRSAFGQDVTNDVGIHINKGDNIKVGLGRSNPNADKGRERRGKSKKNTSK